MFPIQVGEFMSDNEKRIIRVNDVHGNFVNINVEELEDFYKAQMKIKQDLKDKKKEE